MYDNLFRSNVSMEAQDPSMDTLCGIYIKIRNKKQEIAKELEEKIASLDAQLQVIGGTMKDRLVAAGGTSLKTPHGTIYMTQKTKFYAMDWDVFGQWIVKNNAVDLLEKRVAQGNMKKWLEETPNNPPPGLQAETELTVTVRKA
jgi:hypothetical protein